MRNRIRFLLIIGTVALIAAACLPLKDQNSKITDTPSAPSALVPPGVYHSDVLEGNNGIVVAISHDASEAGVSILKQGGNAVDAAVATAFALAVTYPAAGNIGGGGFMLVYPSNNHSESNPAEPVVFDYRETAPAAAKRNMFGKKESQYRPKSVAVPGTVRGLALAHQRFGTLPWKQVIQPAIELADKGFVVEPYLADLLNDVLNSSPDATELQRVFSHPEHRPWKAGDRLKNADFGQTLRLIADNGPDTFYEGPIANSIVEEMSRFGAGSGIAKTDAHNITHNITHDDANASRGDGIITLDDLKAYRAIERKPLTTRYRNEFDIFTTPPPSSGGTCLIEQLNMLEQFDVNQRWTRWSPELFHVMSEIMQRGAYDRARYLGDPAFTAIPANLVTKLYAQHLTQTIHLQKVTRSIDLATDINLVPESDNTTHFSVVDSSGMAVANTYTLERIWGSRIVVKNRGFILNNDMRAFNIHPGPTLANGTIGTEPNTIAPGKRPISSQMPTIVAKNGRAILVTGSPGSQAIPNTIFNILVSTIDYQMPLPVAVDAPRFSHAWLPDQITFEAPERFPALITSLKTMGHTLVRTGPLAQGDAHSIWITAPNRYIGVCDRRRNNQSRASGY